jgi:hypothetical protein
MPREEFQRFCVASRLWAEHIVLMRRIKLVLIQFIANSKGALQMLQKDVQHVVLTVSSLEYSKVMKCVNRLSVNDYPLNEKHRF